MVHRYASVFFVLSSMALGRVHAQAGSLDPLFGTAGTVTMDLQGTDAFKTTGLAVAPDGGLYVCGSATVAGVKQFALAHFLENGTPDPSFGTGGFVVSDVSDLEDEAFGVAIANDDRILVVGTSSEFWSNTSWITVAAYKTGGTLDPAFGDGTGIVHTVLDSGLKATGHAIAVDSDGSFLVGGSAEEVNADMQALVVRYHADGSVDQDFGELGIGQFGMGLLGPGYFRESINAMLITPEGDIVAVGDCDAPGSPSLRAYKLRLHSDGSDSPFAPNNFAWVSSPSRGNGLARQSDDHYVMVGQTDVGGPTMAYHRCDPDGTTDTSDMVWFLDPGPRNSYGYAVAVDANDNALLAGSVNAGNGGRAFALTRLQATCQSDAIFGNQGQVITAVGNESYAEARAIAVQGDGKIVLAGNARVDGRDHLALARYLSDQEVGTADAATANLLGIFPNPAHDVVLVDYTQHEAGAARAQLLNAMGQVVSAPQIDATTGIGRQRGTVTLPAGLAPGAYLLRITTGNEARTARVIVQ